MRVELYDVTQSASLSQSSYALSVTGPANITMVSNNGHNITQLLRSRNTHTGAPVLAGDKSSLPYYIAAQLPPQPATRNGLALNQQQQSGSHQPPPPQQQPQQPHRFTHSPNYQFHVCIQVSYLYQKKRLVLVLKLSMICVFTGESGNASFRTSSSLLLWWFRASATNLPISPSGIPSTLSPPSYRSVYDTQRYY